MVRIVVSILIVCLLGGTIGIALATSNRLYKDSGTFEDFPNMDGNWESAADALGPLQVESNRKVYIDIDKAEDVYASNSSFMSYAENPMFSGTYMLSATIDIPDVGSNENGDDFNGTWWDYESNGYRTLQVDDEPQNINLTSAYSWANGAAPDPENPKETGSDYQPIAPPDVDEYRVYTHVPF